MEKSLNKLVSVFNYGDYDFEIDELLDQRNRHEYGSSVFHLFFMDGSRHGRHIGIDFPSVIEAKDFARSFAKGEADELYL